MTDSNFGDRLGLIGIYFAAGIGDFLERKFQK